MLNLQWRLKALDADAAESLRVITIFDALSQARAGVEALLRTSASLTTAQVGVVECDSGISILTDPSGATHHRSVDLRDGSRRRLDTEVPREIFLIRESGAAHANDDLVLERLALSLNQAYERAHRPLRRAAVDVLLDESSDEAECLEAVARLRLAPGDQIRVVASPFTGLAAASARAGIAYTSVGIVRVEILDALTQPDHPRAGIGVRSLPRDTFRSWMSALAALRISTARRPVVNADDFGSLLDLLAAHDSIDQRFSKLLDTHRWSLETIEALARAEGVRGAARELGIHHSTAQSRVRTLAASLGYDPSRGIGIARLSVSFYAHLFATQRF